MWWGKGDTSKLTDDEKVALAHLRRFEETGHLRTLPSERVDIAVEAIDFFGQWKSFLKLMTSFKNVSLLLGAILGIYWMSRGAVASFVMETIAAGGPPTP